MWIHSEYLKAMLLKYDGKYETPKFLMFNI